MIQNLRITVYCAIGPVVKSAYTISNGQMVWRWLLKSWAFGWVLNFKTYIRIKYDQLVSCFKVVLEEGNASLEGK